MRRIQALIPFSVLLLAACGGAPPAERSAPDATPDAAAAETSTPATTRVETLSFSPALGIDLNAMERTATGVYRRDISIGEGAQAKAGDVVAVHFVGWLTDGTRFDNSRDFDTPLEFKLGNGDVIPAWEENILGMHVGGKRQLVVPPEQAYGATGSPGVVPPNATLVYELELVDIF